MEAVAEKRITLDSTDKIDLQPPAWDEALVRVQAYLGATRVGDAEWARNCAQEVVNSAMEGNIPEGREMEAALREADEFLKGLAQDESEVSEEIIKLLVFGVSANGTLGQEQRERLLTQIKIPARPPETPSMRMQTSLSRLPSIRLIGGWIVLIALLFVVFLLTHR